MEEKVVPKLTLTPELEVPEAAVPALVEEEKKPAEPAGPDMSMLSEEEQMQVTEFAKSIDLTNSQLVLQYGSGAQKNIAQFSETALGSVRTKDLGEVGDMITDLVVELKGFDAEEEAKGFLGLFKKAGRSMEAMKVKYGKAEQNVEKIATRLEGHQIVLMKDIAILDQMYDKNLAYYKELTMYILAGQQALAEARTVTLPALREKAAQTGLAEDAQRANDYDNLCVRFEKKLHDLELTRVVSMQMAPQIRMIQNNDTIMAEKIQTSLVNTIPLWKSQMVLALGLSHSQQAIEAQRQVSDMTNALLRKNAAMLKSATLETARESERAVVDIETLKVTNESLISTLDEVLQIQTEGAQKRREAEQELRRIEGELKQKLLETRSVM